MEVEQSVSSLLATTYILNHLLPPDSSLSVFDNLHFIHKFLSSTLFVMLIERDIHFLF